MKETIQKPNLLHNGDKGMEILTLLEQSTNLNWNYDAEADVLYISFGTPQISETIDIGNGLLVRFAPDNRQITGFTLLNPVRRTLEALHPVATRAA